jgi:hypothetical protein
MADDSAKLTIEMARLAAEDMYREDTAKMIKAAYPLAQRCMALEAYGRSVQDPIDNGTTVGVSMGHLRAICDAVTEVMSR